MKKALLFVLTAILLLGAFACTGADAAIDGEALYEKMAALGTFPEMMRRSGDAVLDYYGIDPDACKQLVNYASADGLLADEFLFAETNDETYAIEIEALLREQIARQAETYREYMPEEYPKLSDARIERSGCRVLVIVSDDASALYKVYTDALR